MLELTNGGFCCGSLEAVEFFERLPDVIPEEAKTEDFCDEYEAALNRLRYLARADIPQQPKLHLGVYGPSKDYETCPHCGRTISKSIGRPRLCDSCGQRFDWSNVSEEYARLRQRKKNRN